CDLQHTKAGEETLKMCVAVRRKLQLYYWKDRSFHELQGDFSVPDVPKSMAWCENSICVGFKRDYYLIRVDGKGSIKELFPTGKQLEPLAVPLADGKVAVGQDDLTVVLNEEGTCTPKCALNWTDIPMAMEHQPPYIIAVLPRYVEVRTFEPRLLVQSIELQRPRFITSGGPNIVYVASNHFVWRLVPVSIATQIQQLLQDKQFELALQLARMKDDANSEKRQQIHHIQNLYAFNLFCQKRFDDSMQVFAKLGTDPTHVIGMYPDLLPSDYKKQLQYPNPVPLLSGAELEKANLALIDYLTQVRSQFIRNTLTTMFAIERAHRVPTRPLPPGAPPRPMIMKILHYRDRDILQKAHEKGEMQYNGAKVFPDFSMEIQKKRTNVALVAPLLRLENNHCHVEESEHVLKKAHKYSELIILYEKKGLHEKALMVLVDQSKKANSPLKGHERTVQYLQRLGAEKISLIFEYCVWVLRDYPEDGLKIFTEDLPEVEILPRNLILAFLLENFKHLAAPYLEHIILIWEDQGPEFHNCLIKLYCEKVQALMQEIGICCIIQFIFLGLLEERALLLGRMGKHEQALFIYVHILKDTNMAEQYCHKHYDYAKDGNKDVSYNTLLMPL
ncbi:hypothetical protein GDO78_016380, partial [Eleutherodactylus coqui]